MARLWAERSGIPPENERKAMEPRLAELKKTIKTSTIGVYPAFAWPKSDVQVARQLAEMLAKQELGRAEVIEMDPKLQIRPNTNQTRIAWDTARVFREFLEKNTPTTDYALFVVYDIGHMPGGRTAVNGVIYVLCDRQGQWVLVGLRNDHWADFQRVNPQSADDCNRLMVDVLGSELR